MIEMRVGSPLVLQCAALSPALLFSFAGVRGPICTSAHTGRRQRKRVLLSSACL